MSQRKLQLMTALVLAATVLPAPAHAYMGVGAGLSALGSTLSFLGILLLMLFGFVWYPVKRMLKRVRAKSDDTVVAAEAGEE
ncbi:hypothetical protein [Sphingomicrobium nitratireducens]|uniref:hypothetical protein n=1 Tax=Sphingomicrobium nitratireducens TaxID=2964666 RepID=UPI00223FAD3B|nr:hypothetical protein [Sphingomicrobium nitratireducens]